VFGEEQQPFMMVEHVRVDEVMHVAGPQGAFVKHNVVTLWLKVPLRTPRAYYSLYQVGELAKYVVRLALARI
jgi:hypothetical protein